MAKGLGRQIQIGIARETSRGTPESAATYYVPVDEATVQEKFTLAQDEQTRGVIEDAVGATKVKEWAEHSYKAPIGNKHFPLILYGMLGTLNSATNADGSGLVYDHTITVAQSAQHQALSLFKDDPLAAQDYKYALGVMTSLEIAYEANKFLEYTAKFKSLKGATATLTPGATAADNRFVHKHITFKVASALSGLSGASAMKIKSLQLRFSPNVEDDDVIGSTNGAPVDFLNKQFVIEGTIEALWQNESDFFTAALAQTAKALRIDLIDVDTTIGSAANPEVRIDLAKVIFQDITAPVKINDLMRQTLTFKAYYSTGDSKMITCLCTNLVASY